MLDKKIYNKFWDFIDEFLSNKYQYDYYDVYRLCGRNVKHIRDAILINRLKKNYDLCIDGYVDLLRETAISNNNIIPPGVLIEMISDLMPANDISVSLLIMIKVLSDLLAYSRTHSPSFDVTNLVDRIQQILPDLIKAIRSRSPKMLQKEVSEYAGNPNYQFLQSESWILQQINDSNELLDKWGL